MKNLLKTYDLMTSEQEVFFWSVVVGAIFLSVVAYIGYRVYQSRPCACSPGGDDTEKLDTHGAVSSIRYFVPGRNDLIIYRGKIGSA